MGPIRKRLGAEEYTKIIVLVQRKIAMFVLERWVLVVRRQNATFKN